MTKTKLKKLLWIEIRSFIKRRDKHICLLCKKTTLGSNAHGSHILPKSLYPGYEFEEWNLKTLCMHCHLGIFHKDPLMVSIDFEKKHPEKYKKAVSMAKKYNKSIKYSEKDLVAKYKYYIEKNS